MARYFYLSCGHYCPADVAELYRVFQKIDVFCEQCNEFKSVEKRIARDDIPPDKGLW